MDIKYSEESCTAQSTPSCSGVIVGAKTILTTAHCFFHRNPCLAIEENMPLPPKTFIDLSSVKVKTMPGHIDENSYDVEEITLLGGFQRPYQDIQYTALHDIAVVTVRFQYFYIKPFLSYYLFY
jgi:V8-like Glu-specific endopeptidase